MKARIQHNVWGNWYGYLGTKRVAQFFNTPTETQEQQANQWLTEQHLWTHRINWPALRLGFHCHCKICVDSMMGQLGKKAGKRWQAMYGESATDFKKRYEKFHVEEQ